MQGTVPAVNVLFVHGMGRSSLSGWPLLRQLKRAGLTTTTFGYIVSLEDFVRIKGRLASRISALAARGDYVLIGHSLGGVLLRAAVNSMSAKTQQPRHVFLLGSPLQPARLAISLGSNPIYRALTRDCGQLLGSVSRMADVGPVSAPTTGIAGIRGMSWKPSPFGVELNDGVVSLSEVSADWLTDQVQVSSVHTLLPSSKRVAEIILERLERKMA